jgi:hypothetical protein
MKRYIDADALLSRLPDDLPYKASVKRVLMQAPTADVVEVRHGHWTKEFAWSYGYTDHHKLTCSECGLTFTEDARSVDEYKYCYGCGAKMDLEGRSEK